MTTRTGPLTVTTPAGVPFIDLERTLDAPRALVLRAYTEPDLLIQWLGPAKYEMRIDHFEARDGGRWRYVHRASDGTEFAFHGVFHGDPSPDGLTQTFEFELWPGHVALDAVRFEEVDGRTIVRTHSTYQSVEARDAMAESGMADGVADGYRRLDELLARLQADA
jgi:uncharacterized protein YndB with AHSA1/START domain